MQSNSDSNLQKIYISNFIIGLVSVSDIVYKTAQILLSAGPTPKKQKRYNKLITASGSILTNYRSKSGVYDDAKLMKSYCKVIVPSVELLTNRDPVLFTIVDTTTGDKKLLIPNIDIHRVYSALSEDEKNSLWQCLQLMYVSCYRGMYVANLETGDINVVEAMKAGLVNIGHIETMLSGGVSINGLQFMPFKKQQKSQIPEETKSGDQVVSGGYSMNDLFEGTDTSDPSDEASTFAFVGELTSMIGKLDLNKIDIMNNPDGIDDIIKQLGIEKYLGSEIVNQSIEKINEKMKNIPDEQFDEMANGIINMISPNGSEGANKIYKNMIGSVTSQLKQGINLKDLPGLCKSVKSTLSKQELSKADIATMQSSAPQFMNNLKSTFGSVNGISNLVSNIANSTGQKLDPAMLAQVQKMAKMTMKRR